MDLRFSNEATSLKQEKFEARRLTREHAELDDSAMSVVVEQEKFWKQSEEQEKE